MSAVSRRLTANSLFVTGLPVSGPNFASNASPNFLLSPVSPMRDTKDLSTVTLLSAGALVSTELVSVGTIALSSIFSSLPLCACCVATSISRASISLVTSVTASSADIFAFLIGSTGPASLVLGNKVVFVN